MNRSSRLLFISCCAMLALACGGSTNPPRTPDLAATGANETEGTTRATRALADHADTAQLLNDRQRELVCWLPKQGDKDNPPYLVTELEELQRDAARELARRDLAAGGGGPAAPQQLTDCKNLADNLHGLGEQHLALTRSLCSSLGRPDDGERLANDTSWLWDEYQAALNRSQAATTLDKCYEAVDRMDQLLSNWQPLAWQVCGREAECGVTSPDDSRRQAAMGFCAKPNAQDAQVLAACLRGDASELLVADLQRELGSGSRANANSNSDSNSARGARSLTGGLETAIVRGAADFFVDRAEKELSLFAAEVVGKRLCEDEKVADYLVNTCALMNPDAGDQPVLGATPTAIREAARADLDQLPDKLISKLGRARPELRCPAAIAWAFGKEAMQGVELMKLLTNLDPVLAQVDKDCSGETAQRLLEAVKDVVAAVREAKQDNRDGFADAVRAGRYRGLLRSNSRASRGGSLTELGDAAAEVLRRAGDLDAAIRRVRQDASAAARASVVVAGLRTIQPMLDYAIEQVWQEPGASMLVSDLDVVIQIVTHIGNREYPAAVVAATKLQNLEAFGNAKTRNLVSLAGTLAQAESSEAVRVALEDAALPLQSWRRKNEQRWGITLTGIVGVHPAYEVVVEDLVDDSGVESGGSFAPALMVGSDIHRGFGKARIGFHLNVFDLGALGSIRFEKPQPEDEAKAEAMDADVSEEPEVRIEQVFAPGAYFYGGYGPFDLGVGASFVPSLRPASTDAEPDGALNVVRVGVVLGVDVSVLPLLSRPGSSARLAPTRCRENVALARGRRATLGSPGQRVAHLARGRPRPAVMVWRLP